MMDDTKAFVPAAAPAPLESSDRPAGAGGDAPAPSGPGVSSPVAGLSPAVEKFQSCRWRATPEDGAFCTHRDVLPFAGKEGFVADSWCPECAFYKLRRTPKKRERSDYSY
jgi:hypothetical protein